jgi:cytochrome c biogenesis protein CcmG, thiol:disulfide interchange protein DsbE
VRRLALMALFVLAACNSPSGGTIDGGSPMVLEGTLTSMRGKPVVVNFWATWCDPCREEMPFIVDAANEFSDEVHFLGVNVQDNAAAAKEFAKDYKMRFRSVSDPNREIANDAKLLGLPATMFYDADGELSFLKQGPIKEKELLDKIEDLIRASR